MGQLIEQGNTLKGALPLLLAPTCSMELEDLPLNYHQVKASFLFNLLRFIDWPADACSDDGRLNLSICGAYSLDAFRFLNGARVRNRTIAVQRIKEKELAAIAADKCQVLVIGSDVPVTSVPIARGMLTVGETDGFTACGGIINLLLIDWRVRFQINDELAQACSIAIDSRLLKLRMR